MAFLSLISLNVERKKNVERVITFLREKKPDVACLQEACRENLSEFQKAIGALERFYVPMTLQRELSGEMNEHGLCILSRFPIANTSVKYYAGNDSHVPISDEKIAKTYTSGQNRMVAFCDVTAPDAMYRIGTTHFTWTPKGDPNEQQRRDLGLLLSFLKKEKEFILTGDFNAPRGGEIFSAIAERYKDNIPLKYKTSLDLNLHRATRLGRRHEIENKMIDGLFTTPQYTASDVRLIDGVSDHCAIVATIARRA